MASTSGEERRVVDVVYVMVAYDKPPPPFMNNLCLVRMKNVPTPTETLAQYVKRISPSDREVVGVGRAPHGSPPGFSLSEMSLQAAEQHNALEFLFEYEEQRDLVIKYALSSVRVGGLNKEQGVEEKEGNGSKKAEKIPVPLKRGNFLQLSVQTPAGLLVGVGGKSSLYPLTTIFDVEGVECIDDDDRQSWEAKGIVPLPLGVPVEVTTLVAAASVSIQNKLQFSFDDDEEEEREEREEEEEEQEEQEKEEEGEVTFEVEAVMGEPIDQEKLPFIMIGQLATKTTASANGAKIYLIYGGVYRDQETAEKVFRRILAPEGYKGYLSNSGSKFLPIGI